MATVWEPAFRTSPPVSEKLKTYIRMAQRQVDRRSSFRRCRSLSLSVQRHLGNTGLVRKNLDILHRRTCAFGRNAKRLEHSFLAYPARCKRRPEGRLGTAVRNLSISEVT